MDTADRRDAATEYAEALAAARDKSVPLAVRHLCALRAAKALTVLHPRWSDAERSDALARDLTA